MGCTSSTDETAETDIKILGAENGKKYDAYWMQQMIKAGENDASDLDFANIKVIGKVTSVDNNGIATIITPIEIENTKTIKKIRIQMMNGFDISKHINSVREFRLMKISYSHIEAI